MQEGLFMKTIIIYATKYGAAGEIAQRIASKIDGAVVHNLKKSVPSLEEYDCIILGSSVYAGMIRKEAKYFLSQYGDVLKNKTFGLFLSGLDRGSNEAFFTANFSPEILQNSKAKSFIGGIYDPKKAGFMERFIMRMITKQSGYIDTIKDSKIEKFAEAMKA